MNRCLITQEPCGEERYSARGLTRLSPKLRALLDLPYSAEQQRREAILRAGRMSIQGVQPKLSARLNVKAVTFELVERGGRFILKPQHATFPHLPENESVTMHMAATAGIEVPLQGLVRCQDGSLTYFIKRFDRLGRGSKVATEDFAQLAGRDRETKYSSSMEQLVALLDYCTFPKVERARLLPRVVFNYLVGNEDMHLKNYSLITRNGKVELAPAYDFLSTTIAYLAIGRSMGEMEELALPLGGKKRNISRRLWVDYFASERLGLPAAQIEHCLASLGEGMSRWPELIRTCFLPESQKGLFLQLLESRRRILGL